VSDESTKRGDWYDDIVSTYDTVAEQYATDYFDELSRKPFDRELLTKFAALIPEGGLACDMGCGPGHLARFLANLGVEVIGIDVSRSMIEVARRLNPELAFEQGDMLRLPFADDSFAGIVAFYSLIHIDRSRVPEALAELRRVLSKTGPLLISFHLGEGEIHVEEFHGHRSQTGQKIAFHATLFEMDEMTRFLESAGFAVEEKLTREPYEFEYPSQRGYILARKA
jgi:ubiquinone/menaquinone biosynthesis C-methylase UbiE